MKSWLKGWFPELEKCLEPDNETWFQECGIAHPWPSKGISGESGYVDIVSEDVPLGTVAW